VPQRLWLTTALVAASLGFQSCFITLDAFFSDEGLVLVAADDLAKGRLLYRDCYVPLTPLVYLLQGLAFKLAGSHIIVSRLLMTATYAATVAAVFSMAGRVLPTWRAVLAGVIAIPLQLWMWPHAHFFSYNALATLLCVVAICIAWSVEARPRRLRHAALLGAVLALALWTKPNLAVATGAGIALYWVGGWLRTRIGARRLRDRSGRDLLWEGAAVTAGAVIASAPLTAYLVGVGIFDEMVESLFSLGRIYAEVPPDLFPPLFPPFGQLDAVRLFPGRVLPSLLYMAIYKAPAYRYLLDHSGWIDLGVRVLYYAPIMLWIAVAACLLARLTRGRWEPRDEAALLFFCAGLGLYLTVVPHPAFHYVVPTLLPLVPLATYFWWRAEGGSRGAWCVILRVTGGVVLLAYGVASLGALAAYVGIPRAPVHTAAGTLWVPVDQARSWNAVLEYLHARVPEGALVFAAPYFPILYFGTGYEHPTRFVDLRPGSPGPAAEDEIMLRLEEQSVEWAVYFPGFQFPALERWESAYPRLNRYIEARFERQHTVPGVFGPFAHVLQRRSKPREGAGEPEQP